MRKKEKKKLTEEGIKVRHFTLEENIPSILEKGFDVKRAPIHGMGGFAVGTKVLKLGKNTLYFTTDDERWNNALIYVGVGKGTINQDFFDYEEQKWKKEKKACIKVDLKPVEGTIKSTAKILVLDSPKKLQKFINSTNRRNEIDYVVNKAKKEGYDVLNIKRGEGWVDKEIGTDRDGREDLYNMMTGYSGNDDYFIFNKNILDISKH